MEARREWGPTELAADTIRIHWRPWRRKLASFLLLTLLNLLATLQQSTADSEAFIKVTGFSVPPTARVGDKVRLVCNYSLSQDQQLHAMKLFKDNNEMYRVTPNEDNSTSYHKQAFSVEGLQPDLTSSNSNELVMRILNKLSSGSYKCEVMVEGSFKSISVVKRMEVRERTGPQEVVAMGIVGNGNYQSNQNGLSRQQQQRHAANRRVQQQQQGLNKQPNQFSSTLPVQAVQRGSSSVSSSSPSTFRLEPQQLSLAGLLLAVLFLLQTIIR